MSIEQRLRADSNVFPTSAGALAHGPWPNAHGLTVLALGALMAVAGAGTPADAQVTRGDQRRAIVGTCDLKALPGLAAARARVPRDAAGGSTVVVTALRAASVDEFLQMASAVTGLPVASETLDTLVDDPATTVPCDASALARDRVTYSLLLSGYSAREIADIVSGRLSKVEVDDAQRLLMTGRSPATVAAFLERAMAERERKLQSRLARRTAPRATPAPTPVPRGRRAPATPRQPTVQPPPALAADASIQDAITRLSRQYGVDPGLVTAMVATESGGISHAVSHKGAIGLMQLMPATARMLGVNPADPIDNLRGGIAYLAGLIQQFGNARDALIAYNAGPSHADRVRKGLAVLYGETREYLESIAKRHPF